MESDTQLLELHGCLQQQAKHVESKRLEGGLNNNFVEKQKQEDHVGARAWSTDGTRDYGRTRIARPPKL